jgi:hypothetical protein
MNIKNVHGRIHTVATNTTKQAFRPSDSRLFSCPNTSVLGLGAVIRKATGTTCFVFVNPVPPFDLQSRKAGSHVQQGTETMKQNPTGNHAQTTPAAAPHEAINRPPLPRYQQSGTFHKDRIVTPPSPAKSVDLAMRFILIDSSLTRASKALRMGSLSQSLGATMAAGRHLKQAIGEATTSGRAAR